MDPPDLANAFASAYTVKVTTEGRQRVLFSSMSSGLPKVPWKRNPERIADLMAARDGILEDEAR